MTIKAQPPTPVTVDVDLPKLRQLLGAAGFSRDDLDDLTVVHTVLAVGESQLRHYARTEEAR